MTDDTIETDKPIPFPDKPIDPPEPEVLDEPVRLTAKERLRAYEDEVLGEKAVRISGHIERGSGSHFQTKMTDDQRAHHAALERLVEAEQKLADAGAALASAEAAHRAAEAHVARGEGIANGDDQPE